MQQLLVDKGFLPAGLRGRLGFTGIAVAFLGQNNPIGIIFAAVVWGVLARGETSLQLDTDVPREFVIILQGIFIMSVVVDVPGGETTAVRAGSSAARPRSRTCRTPTAR